MKLLDSSIWLDHLGDKNLKSTSLLQTDEILFTSILSLFEVGKKLRSLGYSQTHLFNILGFIKNRSTILNLDEDIITSAIELSLSKQLAAIDALIYASSLRVNSTLITADNDFRGLANVEIW